MADIVGKAIIIANLKATLVVTTSPARQGVNIQITSSSGVAIPGNTKTTNSNGQCSFEIPHDCFGTITITSTTAYRTGSTTKAVTVGGQTYSATLALTETATLTISTSPAAASLPIVVKQNNSSGANLYSGTTNSSGKISFTISSSNFGKTLYIASTETLRPGSATTTAVTTVGAYTSTVSMHFYHLLNGTKSSSVGTASNWSTGGGSGQGGRQTLTIGTDIVSKFDPGQAADGWAYSPALTCRYLKVTYNLTIKQTQTRTQSMRITSNKNGASPTMLAHNDYTTSGGSGLTLAYGSASSSSRTMYINTYAATYGNAPTTFTIKQIEYIP